MPRRLYRQRRAGWHQTGGQLHVPTNITLLHLPPYSPELNPVEKVGNRSDRAADPEATALLTRKLWCNGDVTLLEAAAARLGVRASRAAL